MRGHGSQWISSKINIWHLGQLKKLKSWEPFGSYQLNSTANPAHLPQNWAKLAVLFRFFSIAMDGDNSFYVKFIAILCPHIFGVCYFSLSHGVGSYFTKAYLTKALWQKLKNPEPLCDFRPQNRDLDPLDIMHYHFQGWMSKNMF